MRLQRRRASRSAWAACASVLALATLSACSDDVRAVPSTGPATVIDPYYPADGNPGYDVRGYDVTATYRPPTSSISASTVVTALATARRSTFSLDLSNLLTVTAVTVNGDAAAFSQQAPHELVVTPVTELAAGLLLHIVVRYHGPLGDSGPISGWHPLSGGGGVMAGEPHSCAHWYPCNDHPTDKATFRLTAAVPARFTVISNGLAGATTSAGSGPAATTTYRWHLDTPTATYLTTILIDTLTVERSKLSDGTPVVDAYSPDALSERANERQLPAILDLLASRFGPYPAPAAGGLFVDAPVGFSLETFTRPIYTAGVPFDTIVHENAHQWWGDNVSIKRWRDICFNECMASYGPWLWREHEGQDLDSYYRETVNDLDFSVPLYDMGAGNEFVFAGVYQKGSYFEHALRRKIDDDKAYFAALQGIQRDFAGSNLGMLDFRDEMTRRTGVDLRDFWDEWVLSAERPSPANLFPGTLAN